MHHFCFSAVAEAVCAPIMATFAFFLFLVPNELNIPQ